MSQEIHKHKCIVKVSAYKNALVYFSLKREINLTTMYIYRYISIILLSKKYLNVML